MSRPTTQPGPGNGRRTPSIGVRVVAASAALGAAVALLVIVVALGVVTQSRPAGCPQSQGVARASSAGHDAIPAELVPIYQAAAAQYRLGDDGWLWLAAINRIETDFGRNLNVSSAGAVGWMQFMPATWAAYGVDADRDGRKDPRDPQDAIHAAANYLGASGAPTNWPRAVFAYNHAGWYVADVTRWHDRYRANGPATTRPANLDIAPGEPDADAAPGSPLTPAAAGGPGACSPATTPSSLDGLQLTDGERARLLPDNTAAAPRSAPLLVKQLIAAGNRIQGKRYSQEAPHGTPYTKVLDHYDCSSSVAFMLFHAGQIKTATENWVSGTFASSFGSPGVGKWVTIRANAGHMYMYVAGLRWDTHRVGSGDRGAEGIGWHTATRSDDARFTPRTPTAL